MLHCKTIPECHCSTQGTLQASPDDADAGSAVKLCQSLLQPFLQGSKKNTKQSLGRFHMMTKKKPAPKNKREHKEHQNFMFSTSSKRSISLLDL